jgi:hypothetical protein
MKGRVKTEREIPLRQRHEMIAAFPGFRYRITRLGGVEWRGGLQPTVDSATYDVSVLHEPNRTPKVRVLRPSIRLNAPHRYGDGSLCLYWPQEWRWNPRESLAATILPWTALWLYYYELWLVTDEWLGPSSPHQNGGKRAA